MIDPTQAPPAAVPSAVRLCDLLGVEADGLAHGIGLDSRQIRAGDVYVALPGELVHGARFAGDAIAAGAIAVVTDPAGAELVGPAPVPIVAVDDPRNLMATLAAELYGHPAEAMTMYGVTGTNGKTSTVFLLRAALVAAGQRVGTIGTIGFEVGGTPLPARRTTVTTPESTDLQALLAQMRQQGAAAVAMEVSSHALVQQRVAGITFDVAGFTHLGRDHLEFHQSIEAYFEAKSRLFLGGAARVAVINVDEAWGRRLADLVRADGGARLVTVGVDSPAADYRVEHWSGKPDGTSQVRLATPTGEHEFAVGMIGEFNVDNALLAAAMLESAGVSIADALPGFATASVPGRMQRVDLGPGSPRVIVDFAHTPEAIAASLDVLPPGRRIVVFGCGGDRDPGKRGPMGAAAAQRADVVIVTDDNPRSEDPAEIRRAALAGARAAATDGVRVLDGGLRRDAIRQALEISEPGDWVAILGKGHEQGQDVGGIVTPFSDVEVVVAEWRAGMGAGKD